MGDLNGKELQSQRTDPFTLSEQNKLFVEENKGEKGIKNVGRVEGKIEQENNGNTGKHSKIYEDEGKF